MAQLVAAQLQCCCSSSPSYVARWDPGLAQHHKPAYPPKSFFCPGLACAALHCRPASSLSTLSFCLALCVSLHLRMHARLTITARAAFTGVWGNSAAAGYTSCMSAFASFTADDGPPPCNVTHSEHPKQRDKHITSRDKHSLTSGTETSPPPPASGNPQSSCGGSGSPPTHHLLHGGWCMQVHNGLLHLCSCCALHKTSFQTT